MLTSGLNFPEAVSVEGGCEFNAQQQLSECSKFHHLFVVSRTIPLHNLLLKDYYFQWKTFITYIYGTNFYCLNSSSNQAINLWPAKDRFFHFTPSQD